MATHNDRDHLHNHFIINSVSFLDKKKLSDNMKMINQVRKVSDELCYRHNLSVIEKEDATKYSPLDQATLNAARQGRSWKFNLVKDLDAALDSCKTKSEFVRFFESKNYEIKFTPQNITFRKIGNKKGIRADTLAKQFGRKYSKSSIEKKLNIAAPTANPKQQQNQQQRFQIPNYDYYNQLAAVNWKRYEKKYAERIKVPKRIYANPNLFVRNPFVFTLRLIRFICNLKGNKPKQKIKSYSTVYKTYSYVDYKNGKKVMGVFSELERNMISQRVKSGLQNAKAKGKQLGRPSTSTDDIPNVFYKHYPKYKNGEINKAEFARLCSLSYPTIFKYIGIVEGRA